MSGDLSLSQSLGGLRVANPDDGGEGSNAPPATCTVVPPGSSESSSSTITEHARPHATSYVLQDSRAPGQDRAYSPAGSDPYASARVARASQATGEQAFSHQLTHQRSGPLSHPPQQGQQQFSSPPANYGRPYMRTSGSGRPMSGMYNHPNMSSSSALSGRGSYRYDEEAQQQMGISRSTSRGAATAMDGPAPSRRQSQQVPGGANVGVPRRSSRRIPGHQATSSRDYGSPYAIEGGPLSSSDEWKERGAAVSTRQDVDSNGRSVSRIVKKGVKDFKFGRTLGEGSYSTVLAATDRQTLREFAIKVLDKRHIIKEKKVKYVNIEKDTLNRLTEHPGIVRLYYTFQDERSLYFVLDLASGGELLGVLKKMGTFDEECTRYYSAQMLDSIAYMHSRGVIHRDLKPENVLLDDQMHTKITDFGTAKILGLKPQSLEGQDTGNDSAGDPMDGADSDRAVSFVGTAEYVSPELLTDKNACKASDLWAFGCIVYQLLAGRPPFKAGNEYQTFQKIVALDYTFPDGFPAVARDLIERLLVLDPAKRLPIRGVQSHPFFNGIQWGKGLWKQKAPRLKPYMPPSAEPIKLSSNGPAAAYSPNIAGIPMAPGSTASHASGQQSSGRPQLRAITELPPPSQLDIDWSPVLNRNNERILKLGNLNVLSSNAPRSPTSNNGEGDTPKKFSRFFGGGAPKKRERLVMVTSSARIIIAAAGGDEKKAKMEVSLVAPGAAYNSFQDAKGLTAFSVDSRDKHLTFEDPRATTSDPDGSKYSTQEWIQSIEWAKELAMSHSVANSYSGDSQYNDLGSSVSSPSSTVGAAEASVDRPASSHQGRLRKEQGDSESVKGRKPRFSKRHSKSGLAAVF